MGNLSAIPSEWWIPRIIGFIVVTLVLASLNRRREAIIHKIRRIFLAECVYFAVVYLMMHAGRTAIESLLEGGIVHFTQKCAYGGCLWQSQVNRGSNV
jgi:hypothetical protein